MELSSVCNFSFQTNYHTLLNPHNKNPKSSLLSYQHPKTPIITSSYNNFPSNYCSNKNFHLQNRCSKSLLIAKNSIRTDTANQTEPPESNTKYSVVTKILSFGHTCWKLQRPYTFIGVISCACGLFGRELFHNTNLLSWSLMLKAFSSLMVILSVNLCTNIINQITDLDIDRINKPDLPLASGEMSIETAWIMSIIVALTGLILTIKLNCGPLFISLYCVSILVGALYSVPPFRWKQNPNTAFSSYFMGLVILNFTCYYASRAAFGLPFEMRHGISTLATRYGAKNITFLCSGIVLLTYVSAILAAIIWPQAFKSNVMLLSHATLAFWLIFQTREFALTNYNPEAGRKFYEFMWKLHYAEYLVYVFI
ncbi:geranylpyrophosphate:olivetolate geranyltransferase, chloroplastic-like isoform X2 [Cannabis sativa]|uniref:geranylpyrophosphate:olivetolate geranyltransferase, chloroplastic-like isoform X2 n=1 Tax=Cannabis sativa TaxID=3483 RepID=UPI0029CA0F99|nr:geranylpyrophosphate:olivetolate geranyltransferase, chloroplastic-like isoform X2 [Cannabis sativa]